MDQRLGFSVTESVLILKFGEWEPFFLGLKILVHGVLENCASWASGILFRDLVVLIKTCIFRLFLFPKEHKIKTKEVFIKTRPTLDLKLN